MESEMRIPLLPLKPYPRAVNKVDWIFKHCYYMIATGKWLPGTKLPSLRQAEREWGVHRLTILKAYAELLEKGFLEARPKSGYYVSPQLESVDINRNRLELEQIYSMIYKKIQKETDLFPLAVFRALVRIAEMRNMEHPECVFVECSKSQAEGHAREIADRFDIPVMALSIDEISGKKWRIPAYARIIITTYFHQKELSGLSHALDQTLLSVPIEISPEVLEEIKSSTEEIIFLESERSLAERTSNDAHWMMNMKSPHVELATNIEEKIDQILGAGIGKRSLPKIFLSQKDWERISENWKKHENVRPITCKISDQAWPNLEKIITLPFGQNAASPKVRVQTGKKGYRAMGR